MLGITYLRWSDLYHKKTHFQTIKKKISKLKRGSVISNLTAINTLFLHIDFSGKFERDFPALQRKLNQAYLKQSVIEDIERTNSQNYPIFSRFGTTFLARFCLLYCSEESNILTDGGTDGGYELGDCLLMLNDYLLSSKEEKNINQGSSQKIQRHLGFQLTPILDFANPLDINRGIVRSEIIYSEILNSEELKKILIEQKLSHFDFAAEFKKATKISVIDYIDITLGILVIYLNAANAPIAQYLTPANFLNQSTLDEKVLRRYLKLESKTAEKFKKILESNKNYLKQHSFTPFRSFSLLEIIDDVFLCVDPFFLIENLGSGIYWKIFDALDKKTKEKFFPVYGFIFELYVRKLITQITSTNSNSPEKGLLLSSPRYRDGNESFDEMIYYPESKHLIVVESKSSFMHTHAKYGKSIKRFYNEIKKKFIEKDNEIGKGIGQLANHVVKLFNKNKRSRYHLENTEFDKYIQQAEKISPILITQEPIVSFHIIEEYLNRNLVQRLKNVKNSVKVNQLTVIDVENLEILKSHLAKGEITLQQCINARVHRDPKYKSMFISFILDNFKEMNDKPEDLGENEILEKAFGRVQEKFFGNNP